MWIWRAAILRNKLIITKRFVDGSKVTDHHAIIPTEQPATLSRLSSEELKIYDLIVRRFIAVLSPAFEYEQTTVKVAIKGEIFHCPRENRKTQRMAECLCGSW